MPTPISSIVPVSTATSVADSAAPELVLQAGSVVDAKVVSVMADNLVRIAIANLSIEVMSEVALSPGQNLQLAVSQNDGTVRLAIVDGASNTATDQVTLTPKAAALTESPALALSATATRNLLTPLEQIAVSVASADAVTKQGSQAPLFANLAAVVTSSDLPVGLKQAVLDVLAQQTPLSPQLVGEDIETAFQKSGLFLEASLASGTTPASGNVPDLKAALLVLRQTLAATSGAIETAAPQAALSTATLPATLASVSRAVTSFKQAVGEMPQAPSLSPDAETGPAPLVPRGATVAAAVLAEAPSQGALPRGVSAGVALSLLQEAVQEMPHAQGSTVAATKVAVPDAHSLDTTPRAPTAPPPFRGALPSPQEIPTSSLAPDTPLSQTVHRLLDDADAAIARQTLLQVASLPDRVDAGGHRIDPTVPQWSFEIPFATPQAPRWRSSRSRATAAAMKPTRRKRRGARASRSTSSRPAPCMR
jgi:hypothetical protein